MQLVLRKSQSKAFMGGVNFEVFAQARMTAEERQLMEQYLQSGTVLVDRDLVTITEGS
jgi:hypothetical protein